MITLAITTFNRHELLLQSFEKVLHDDRVSEIVIVDDCSTAVIYEQVERSVLGIDKVKLYRNETNRGVYHNKKTSVALATKKWCIVFDSDNIIDTGYIDKLFDELPWDRHTEYCPALAEPSFNYSSLSGTRITKENVNTLWKHNQFEAFLNTMNSFFNRDEYLRVWDGSREPISSDSIYMNYTWLAAGNSIQVVEGMKYYHRIHNGSHYVNNCARSNIIHKEIEMKIKALR